ncbi:unnamed protein product [Rotaria sordida]|uniref:DDE Tnp4 domain-containing protein n=1 Tax=Rotaria sordida TaxID=392033 RepID=A0A819L4P0_9BILA|nr:unnamed protein product [Rotaria sordida]CAF3954831.1 unnamed protein product [Rotaria sordida]
MTSSSQIKWDCPECQITMEDRRKYCDSCKSMLVWTCVSSGKSGMYSNYHRHLTRCDYCTPELEEERQQLKEEKQISKVQELRILYDGQRPWSEWSRNNESCAQHTGLDIEQVQFLYSLCEQSITEYCTNRKRQQTIDTDVPYLSPINLLAITLWYLKHYHSERYIATELNFGRSTVNYFLFAIIDILYASAYPKLILLPDDMNDENTAHGPEEYHKLIVDSTCIAINQPGDREQRKVYYYAKSPTNYAFKIQITCDFNHRIVHVSKCFPGSVHDLTILQESGLLEYTEENVQIIGDKAYIGEQYVITPRKKPRGGELTAEEKDFNRSISSARAAIENINRRVKSYAILGSIYKGPYDDLEKITKIAHVVVSLCNLKLSKYPIRSNRV